LAAPSLFAVPVAAVLLIALDTLQFWSSLSFALAVAFVAAVRVNR
jgi:hypothetical protein